MSSTLDLIPDHRHAAVGRPERGRALAGVGNSGGRRRAGRPRCRRVSGPDRPPRGPCPCLSLRLDRPGGRAKGQGRRRDQPAVRAGRGPYPRSPGRNAWLTTHSSRPSKRGRLSRPQAVEQPAASKHIGGYFDPAVAKQLRLLAASEDRTLTALLAEALDMLFQSRQQAHHCPKTRPSARRVRRSIRISLLSSVRPFPACIPVNPILGDIGRVLPHTLYSVMPRLLAIYQPGQSAPGGQGGMVPPPSIFRVGGGGFGARNEAQKGRIRVSVFRARGL